VGQGVAAGAGEAWSGATPNSRPFQLIEFTVNSDAAYQTAFKEAQAWLKSHVGKEPAFSLLNSSHYAAPMVHSVGHENFRLLGADERYDGHRGERKIRGEFGIRPH
jgi:hypothetical protein